MRQSDESYDWLNDPFDEKKAAQDAKGKSTGAWVGLGLGCLVAVVFFVVATAVILGALATFNNA